MALEAVRSVCQLLTPSGHAAAGIPEDFAVYLNSIGKHSSLKQFKHNRFNIVFENCAALSIHLVDIRLFLDSITANNQLIQSVKGDLADESLLAEIRGVGAFYHFVTEPFHRLVLSLKKSSHILDLVPYIQQMEKTLQDLSKQPRILLVDKFEMWTDFPSKSQDTSVFFPQEDHLLDITLELISFLSTHALVTFSRQISKQLSLLSPDTSREESLSVPKSNSISESVFGTLKSLMPNATAEHMETTILWTYNKTNAWLTSLPEQERRNYFALARSKSTAFAKCFKERRYQLRHERLEHLKAKKEVQVSKELKSSAHREKTVDNVMEHGGHLRTVEEVTELMASQCSIKELTRILKNNLSYYKEVIKPPGIDKVLYQATHKRHVFTNVELSEHLQDIITKYRQSLQKVQPVLPAGSLVGKEERTRKVAEAKKRVLSAYSLKSDATTKKKCPGPMPDICGRNIRHRWKLTGKKNHVWYLGRVMGISADGSLPSFPEDDDDATLASYTLYDVKYDGEDDMYQIRLEKDWHNRDMELVEL